MVPRVCHRHVAIRCESQALGAIKRVCWCVDIGEERPWAVKHLDGYGELKDRLDEWLTGYCKCNAVPIIHFLKLTWIRLFPQSATMIFPLASTATPVGALNWPFPSPCEPNLNKNSPSALYTCQVRLSMGEWCCHIKTSEEKCQSHPHSMWGTAVFGFWLCGIWLSLPAFSCSVETDWF